MPKTQFKKSKRRNVRKSRSTRSIRSRKFRRSISRKGGCSNGTCVTESTTPQWISKGGDSEISKDINNYTTDSIFYSPSK
jgi:hypothetical protein